MSKDYDEITPDVEEIGKVYEWDGVPLEPLSFSRIQAVRRLGVLRGDDMQSEQEAAAATVFLCTLPESQVVMIRGAGIADFFTKLGAWADENGIGIGDGRKERSAIIHSLYVDMLADYLEAERVIPDLKAGQSGKA